MMEQKQYELAAQVLREVQKVILGKREIVEKVLMAVLAQGHVLLDDVPGVGKTTLAMAFARALGLETRRVQFTPDTMPSDILGFSVYDKQAGAFSYQPGAVMTNLLLADEINRTSTKTQAALLEAMEERRVTVDGKTHPLPQPFFVLATQNPVGSAGTQLLPPAQLDRFLMKITMDYPSLDEEVNILERHHSNAALVKLDDITPALTKEELLTLRAFMKNVLVDRTLLQYIALIVQQTRTSKAVYLGASPRASVAMMQASKAYALLQGRDFVTPEDIKFVAPYVLQHRLILTAEAEMEGYSPVKVTQRLIDKVEVPK